ncbi:MAG TPA: amidase [Rhodanobacteraceae bacterium]|nr:amidase [Rhodanobacteraceae bacterium]
MNASRNETPDLDDTALRTASMCQALHWLAVGRTTPIELAQAYRHASERLNPAINAYLNVYGDMIAEQAEAASRRRARGVLGRLDGVPIAIKDNLDIAGWPTRAGLPARTESRADGDANAVARLRAAGAVLMGKTNMDEGALGAVTANPHYGATQNPFRAGYTAGGSSGGSAAAVAAGLAAAAIGSDSLGSVRIPASYCGLCAIKPTHGEISIRGMVPAARRLDAIGMLARSVDDLTVLLQVLGGYDAEDPRSRRRRVALATPDWEPGRLRTGVLGDLRAVGVDAAIVELFDAAVERLHRELGERHAIDFADWSFASARRSGLLLMEAEMRITFAEDLANRETPVSDGFRAMLDYAGARSASDYVTADRVLDAATLKARRLFAQVDVLLLPTTPQPAFPLDGPVPDNQADLTSFANLAGCPAVSIPMGMVDGLPVGLQLVGPPGSDLRLLELSAICAAGLDATPSYPI